MNPKKFFEICKDYKIDQSQLTVTRSTKFSLKLFHGEIDGYTIADSYEITARGIKDGKMGAASTEKLDNHTFDFLAKNIVTSAACNEKPIVVGLFEGSKKYHKKNIYNPELEKVTSEQKIALLHQIEDELRAYDKRIVEVSVLGYEEIALQTEFYNSLGLKLRDKSNYFYVMAQVVAKVGEEVKTGFGIEIGNDFNEFNVKETVKKIAEQALVKFGGEPCVSDKYPTVLKGEIFAQFVEAFMSSTSSEEVQKQSSFLAGKVGEKIASSKLTIDEKPLAKNLFFSYFDGEGVAKTNKTVVKNGVLQTFLYNRETAAKEGRETTGNGTYVGSKLDVTYGNVFVKPGKASFDELIKDIDKGVYITEIAGLGTGMNVRSGDFSCQAEGFMIENGKLTKPLNLITLSGNILQMLKDLKGLDNKVETFLNSITCSDAYIKKMSIGGK